MTVKGGPGSELTWSGVCSRVRITLSPVGVMMRQCNETGQQLRLSDNLQKGPWRIYNAVWLANGKEMTLPPKILELSRKE